MKPNRHTKFSAESHPSYEQSIDSPPLEFGKKKEKGRKEGGRVRRGEKAICISRDNLCPLSNFGLNMRRFLILQYNKTLICITETLLKT